DDGFDARQYGLPSVPYVSRLQDGVRGLRLGIVQEGFGWPGLSDPEVDRSVHDGARMFAGLGVEVVEASVPFHRDALCAFDLILLEGGNFCVFEDRGWGSNWDGRTSPSISAALEAVPLDDITALSDTAQFVRIAGTYLRREFGGRMYALARSFVADLRAQYD